MEEKFELRHKAQYLPYKVRGSVNYRGEMIDQWLTQEYVYSKTFKPYLRPLRELELDEFMEGLKTLYRSKGISLELIGFDGTISLSVTYRLKSDIVRMDLIRHGSIEQSPYFFVQWLLENHFDIDGLINRGVALDLKTMK